MINVGWRHHRAHAILSGHELGGGVSEGNDLRDNGNGPWSIDKDSAGKVTRRGNVE